MILFIMVNNLSYSAGTGVFAGDVECDKVFTNNDIRHTITIISNLGRKSKKYPIFSSSEEDQTELIILSLVTLMLSQKCKDVAA